MTKKDFELLASALREAMRQSPANPGVRTGVEIAAREVAAVLRLHEPALRLDAVHG